jgi:hypothetical protein
MDFNKLLDMLTNSARLGFAVFFAGLCIFVGQALNIWPFTLFQDNLSYVLYAMLVGAGLVFLRLLSWLKEGSTNIWAGITNWREKWTVMDRVNELTPPQQAALMWIAENPDQNVSGSRYDEPFSALVDSKYLYARSSDGRKQGFGVNSRVYKKKDKLAALLPKHIVDSLSGAEAPWKQRRR